MSVGFFQDSKGNKSMMRLGFLATTVVGSLVALAGAVAMFWNYEHAGTAITTGMGALASGGWAKAVQTKYESNPNKTDSSAS